MYFEIKDFPAMPAELQQDCLNVIASESPLVKLSYGEKEFATDFVLKSRPTHYDNHLGFDTTTGIYDYIKSSGKQYIYFGIYRVPTEVTNWFYSEVFPLISNQYVATHINIVRMWGGEVVYPHVDKNELALNFIIQPSCDKDVTQFWEPKEQYKDQNIYQVNIYPIEKLDLVDEIIVPHNSWVILNTSKLHSVENLEKTSQRVLFQVEVIEI